MNSADRVYVWDRLVRSSHWLVASVVFANWFLLDAHKHWHHWAGYAACGIIGLRWVWGFAGSRHARFSDWFPTPSRLFPYLKLLLQRREPRVTGHNPAGALMMLALWALVVSLGVTGYLMGTDRFWGEEWLENLHEGLSNVLMACVAVHVLAALYESRRHGENLVRAMITGYKRAE
jgi:cytochrome b